MSSIWFIGDLHFGHEKVSAIRGFDTTEEHNISIIKKWHRQVRPEDVQQRFKDAQNAQTELLKAETEAETAKTKAEGEAQAEIAKANGEAEANRILSQSLTPQVLQQRWIDAIKGSSTIIVPQDFTALGNLVPQK